MCINTHNRLGKKRRRGSGGKINAAILLIINIHSSKLRCLLVHFEKCRANKRMITFIIAGKFTSGAGKYNN